MLKLTIPVNPKNPPGDRPNAERSEAEIRAWWCRPYIVGGGDAWDIRVLDGGAWDRSSWQARFNTLERAVEFAERLHEIYWTNLSCNELPVPFPYQQLLSPLPGQSQMLAAELVGPARLVQDLKAEFQPD